MTNFEKIKSMTIEEMARYLPCPFTHFEDYNGHFDEMACIEAMSCYECCKKWLESEATETHE